MKNIKKYLAVIAAVGVIGTASIAFAGTPADIVSALTGKSVADLSSERASGKTYGTIAKEAGKLDEFKAQMLNEKKAVLDQRVKEGRLTQAQADEVYNTIKSNQATCDGTGSAKIGQKYNAGFGKGSCKGLGIGSKNGMGKGQGRGQNCNGTCR